MVQDRLDARRLACAGVTIEQHIVGLTALDEGFCIVNKALLLTLVADEVAESHISRRRDGFEQFPCRLVVGRDAECLVESEHADTVAAVEVRNDGEHLFSVGCLFDGATELLHFFAHALVVNLLLFFHGMIVFDDVETVKTQCFFQRREIIVEQFAEYVHVVLCERLHTALARAVFFADERKGCLRHCEQKREIVMPEVAVESVARRKIEQAVDLCQDTTSEYIWAFLPFLERTADIGKLEQDALLTDFAVDDEF